MLPQLAEDILQEFVGNMFLLGNDFGGNGALPLLSVQEKQRLDGVFGSLR
jgi:hypothetical protein